MDNIPILTPERQALLQALAKQAAAWWRRQLEDPGYLGKFQNGDRSRAGEMAQIMASMAALRSPGPATETLDRFEQLLTDTILGWMQREPVAKWERPLSTDYGPEGPLREAAEAAGVSGFPCKTTMWVKWGAEPAACYVDVRHGYGAAVQRLPAPATVA
ncbi:hypothetical protein GCM10027594_07770 [Hymenobacter agri]